MIQDHIEDIIKCTRCGRCRALCPIHEELGWESTNARGRMLLARALAEGEKPSEAMKNFILYLPDLRHVLGDLPVRGKAGCRRGDSPR